MSIKQLCLEINIPWFLYQNKQQDTWHFLQFLNKNTNNISSILKIKSYRIGMKSEISPSCFSHGSNSTSLARGSYCSTHSDLSCTMSICLCMCAAFCTQKSDQNQIVHVILQPIEFILKELIYYNNLHQPIPPIQYVNLYHTLAFLCYDQENVLPTISFLQFKHTT